MSAGRSRAHPCRSAPVPVNAGKTHALEEHPISEDVGRVSRGVFVDADTVHGDIAGFQLLRQLLHERSRVAGSVISAQKAMNVQVDSSIDINHH